MIAPATVGAKAMAAMHLAAAGRVLVQVVWVALRVKPRLAESFRSVMPVWPEFWMVTVWVGLVTPRRVAPKFKVEGLVMSRAGVRPMPLRLVDSLATPGVVLAAVKKAVLPPGVVGWKVTMVEQLDSEARELEQLEEPRVKSLAALPEIWMVRPESGRPPVLVRAMDWPIEATPMGLEAKVRVRGLRVSVGGRMPVPVTGS